MTRCSLLAYSLLLITICLPAHAATLSSPGFVVRYDSVDIALAREVADQAEKSLKQVSSQLYHSPDVKIVIVLASSEETFANSVEGKVPEWGLAFAFSANRKIVMKSPRLLKKNIDLAAVLTHEVTHVLLHSFLKGNDIPLWLNEGFAMYQSREWKIGNSAVVGWAVVKDRLYDLEQLETNFPWSEEGADLAYAESFLAVAYIIQKFGKEGLMGLFADLREGMDIDQAMRRRFGIGYRKFRRDWMTHTKNRFSVLSLVISPPSLWAVVLGLFIIVFIRKRIQRRRMIADQALHEGGMDTTWMDDDSYDV